MRARFFFLILTVLATSACTSNHDDDGFQMIGYSGLEPGITSADPSWTPDQMSIVCGEESCPDAVGLVVFPGAATRNGILIDRCTAFATGPREIRTAAHCDKTGQRTGYFLRVGRPITEPAKRIVRLIERKYVPPKNAKPGSDRASGFPDYATYEIDSDLDGITPLTVAAANDLRTKISYLYVTRPIIPASTKFRQGLEFEVKRLQCAHRKDPKLYPFEAKEEVDVVYAFDCHPQPGDSGAPLISLATGHVEGSSIGEFEDEKMQAAGSAISNFRCFQSSCVHNDSSTRADRILKTYQKLVDSLANVRPRLGDPAVNYQTVRLQLIDKNPVKYEVIFIPKCRRDSTTPKEVVLPYELLAISDNGLGDNVWKRLQYTQIKAAVERQDGDRFQVNVGQWPADFEELLRSESHPRVRWGTRFSIDLPICAR